MFLIQILLPVDARRANSRASLGEVRRELIARFGGLTAYNRSPARGLWRDQDTGAVIPDDIIVLEVMVPTVDTDWWSTYRKSLEQRFEQEEIVIRAHETRLL